MSEQLYKTNHLAGLISAFTEKLIKGNVNKEKVLTVLKECENALPHDFISAVDALVDRYPVTIELKKGINKMLNVFYTHLSILPEAEIIDGSFLSIMVKDNKAIVEQMNLLRPLIKDLQGTELPSSELFNRLNTHLVKLSKTELHYQVMENILFPFLEKQWPDHRCLKVLWSVHDDAREELRALKKLSKTNSWNLKQFNRLTGDLFFNLKTIIFREEKILIPAIAEAGFVEDLDDYLMEAAEIGWSFVKTPKNANPDVRTKAGQIGSNVIFATGSLTPQQIEMIFNHLPVDITYVDESDTVLFFSTPKKRTFTRTNAVIGRKVQNCHPPESVWMVEEILDAFRKGEQDDASFWIPFGDQFVYIQYFALRDSDAKYCGTIEVTQDVKEIRALKGERRLLNWKK